MSVLVLSNSLGTNLHMWDAVAERLEPRFDLVRYDQRAHDTLAALGRDVLERLDERGVERASFCGLSLGGMTGMWLAAHVPERIDRLVLCCTSAHLGPRELWDERIAAVREAGTVEVMADAAMDRWLTPAFRAANPDAEALLHGMVAGTDPAVYLANCRAIRDMDLRGALGNITAPTLVIAGTEDPATPPEHAERIVAGIPGARLELLPTAHLAAVERPDDVAALILDHLEVAP